MSHHEVEDMASALAAVAAKDRGELLVEMRAMEAMEEGPEKEAARAALAQREEVVVLKEEQAGKLVGYAEQRVAWPSLPPGRPSSPRRAHVPKVPAG